MTRSSIETSERWTARLIAAATHSGAVPHRNGDRAQAVGELLVVDRDPCVTHGCQRVGQSLPLGQRVRPALLELHLVEHRRELRLGQAGEEHLPHRRAVRGQPRADVEVEVDLALALLGAPAALDVDDVGAVEDRHVDRVAGLVGELLEMGGRDLPQLHRVDRREPEVEHPRAEAVLARLRVLLEVPEARERRDVPVRRAPRQPEHTRELADPELGRGRLERGENRQTAFQGLRLARARLRALAGRHDPHSRRAFR